MQGTQLGNQIEKNSALFYAIRKTQKKNGTPYQEQDKIEKIKHFLSQGADVNTQDKNDNDRTILHIAVQHTCRKIIEFLIGDKKADTSIKDAQGQSIKDIVRESGNQDLVSLFKRLNVNIRKHDSDTIKIEKAKRQKIDIQEDLKMQQHKSHLHKFILDLFGIHVSDHVLVDINLSENPGDNQVTIVGRPAVLGSSKKQMRHITPYSFIVNAIISQIEVEQEKVPASLNVMLNFVRKIIPSLLTMKEGICLSEEDFQLHIKNNEGAILNKYKRKKLTSVDLYETRLETSTHDNPGIKNIYYLVNNPCVIESWKEHKKPNGSEVKDVEEKYYAKWQKYIQFVIEYLNEEIEDNEYAVIESAELIARLILTIFNQSKYACFAEEGNTLSEEIRVYGKAEDAREHNDDYDVYSHAKICVDKEYNKVATADPLVRLVDNEGSIVKRASRALNLVNSILEFQDEEYEKDNILKEYIREYNDYCKFDTIVPLPEGELLKYNEKLSTSNYKKAYVYHVAKHLYSVFDFKPLEREVLVPTKVDPKQVQVRVYPSATGVSTSYYAKKNGDEYREESYNAAKGYNEHALFRHLLTPDQTKELLIEKIVSHFFISLIPFPWLISPCSKKEQSKDLLKNTFNAFYTLVQQDYLKTSCINLGEFFDESNTLCQIVQKKWNRILNSITTDYLNKSDVSSNLDQVEVIATKTTITKGMPDSF